MARGTALVVNKRAEAPLSGILFAIASVILAPAVSAEARCEGPTSDGNVWNLICAADDSHEAGDDYQCDYIISVSTPDGMTEEQEATGSVSPGQANVVIWSTADYGDDSRVTGASIVRGSCSRCRRASRTQQGDEAAKTSAERTIAGLPEPHR